MMDARARFQVVEFIRSIGREGEGPGEFRQPSAMLFTPDGNVAVVQMMPAKVVLLSKEGDPLGEQPLPKPEDGGFQLVQGAKSGGGNTVLFMARQQMAEGKWSRTSFLASVSGEGDQLAEYSTKTNEILFADARPRVRHADDGELLGLAPRITRGFGGSVGNAGLSRCVDALGLDRDTAAVADRFQRVENQVEKDLAQQFAVHQEGRDVGGKLTPNLDPRPVPPSAGHIDGLVEQGDQLGGGQIW